MDDLEIGGWTRSLKDPNGALQQQTVIRFFQKFRYE
jgi:hypothetical protein